MRNHYKKVSSGFKEWDQGSHAEEYTIFASNIDEKLSIDEVSLSDGELYTLLTANLIPISVSKPPTQNKINDKANIKNAKIVRYLAP